MQATPALNIVLYTEGLSFTGDTIEKQALGGSETAFIYVARELAAMGHHVYAYCPCSMPGIYHGVVYDKLEALGYWFGNTCDIFICSRYFYVFHQPVQAKVKLLWLHDILQPGHVPALQQLLPAIDAVFCLSEFHCQLSRELIPSITRRLRKSVNGIDWQLANKAREAVDAKRHRIMFTSRPERGLMRVLQLYEALNDTSLELLACSYTSLPDPYTQQVEQQCQQFIADLQARGFPVSQGSFTKAQLYRELAASKLVLYPTDFPEIFCISAVEAQACGTAFLASDAFALKETVWGGRIPGGDTNSFLQQAKVLLYDDEQRTKWEEAGLQFVQTFTWERVAGDFIIEALQQIRTRNKLPNQVTAINTDAVIDNSAPLISCLTLTTNRLPLLKQAIQCYCRQTYPNREMVIVCGGSDRYQQAVTRFIDSLHRNDIRVVPVTGSQTSHLGRMRNLSLDYAKGDLFCIWDDDDLYHPLRLEYQYRRLVSQSATACFMTDHLQLFEHEQQLFWVDWVSLRDVRPEEHWIPGSVMAYCNDALRYPDTQDLGEDISFRDLLLQTPGQTVTTLDGHGYLYLYRFHGRNAWPLQHHRNITSWGNSSAGYINKRKKELFEALATFPLPKPVQFKDVSGQTVFTYV